MSHRDQDPAHAADRNDSLHSASLAHSGHFGSLAFSTRTVDDHCRVAYSVGREVHYSDDTGFVYVDPEQAVWS